MGSSAPTPRLPLRAVLTEARRKLAQAAIPDPAFEARLLLEHFAGVSAVETVTTPEKPVSAEALRKIEGALARRLGGEPLHRILGWREFHGLRFDLSSETLEPRPDTETLVDATLPLVRETVRREGACRILDLGTGTGAIALALLHSVPGAEAVGVDVSAEALRTASGNAARLGLESRFRPLLSSWFDGVERRYHLIVANPPYISHEELASLPEEVARFDPRTALDGGPDGLDAYHAIAARAAEYLERNGRVAVEIGHMQRDAVTALFGQAGFPLRSAHRDLGGNDRVLVFAGPENAGKA